jgi:hypothetical protein
MKHNKRIEYRFLVTMLVANSALAEPHEEGAFKGSLGDDRTVCFSRQTFARMKTDSWLEYMQSLGNSCTVEESDDALPSRWSLKAHCQNGGAVSHEYQLSFSGFGQTEKKIMFDSKITDNEGNIVLKRAFLGDYTGPCQGDIPNFPIEEYFDLPSRQYEKVSSQASISVANDLFYCGAVFNELSMLVNPEKSEALLQLGTAFNQEAKKLVKDDTQHILKEISLAAQNVAEELKGASAKEMVQLSKSERCAPFMKGDFEESVDRLLLEREQTLSVK